MPGRLLCADQSKMQFNAFSWVRSRRHCGNVYNWLFYGVVENPVCRMWESSFFAFPCAVNRVFHNGIACYAYFHDAVMWFELLGVTCDTLREEAMKDKQHKISKSQTEKRKNLT